MILNLVMDEKTIKRYFIDAFVQKGLFRDRLRLLCWDMENPKKRFDKKLSMFILKYQSNFFYQPMNFNEKFKELLRNLNGFLKPSLRNGYIIGALYLFMKAPYYRKRLMNDFHFNPMSSINLIPSERVVFNNFSSLGLSLLPINDMITLEYISKLSKTKINLMLELRLSQIS